MDLLSWIIAAVFLPLFPLSMIFNAVFQRVRGSWVRVVLLLVWPMPGLWLLQNTTTELTSWLSYWALLSALLYGFRAVVVREFGVWTGFMATSAWSLSWIALSAGVTVDNLALQVLAFSLPLALLAVLIAEIERRYESAYAGIVNSVAQAQPRLAGILVLVMLAVVASPLFPAFFAMLNTILHITTLLPAIAFGLVLVWLLWSWSSVRLLQDLLVGSALPDSRFEDLSRGMTFLYGMALLLLIIGGLYLSEVLL